MTELTPSQQRAVKARGNVLVVAGAGTGKTSTLVERCMDVLDEGCSLERILLVTFTEAAAVEMRGRIRSALQERAGAVRDTNAMGEDRREHFEKQLALLDAAFISTLHSFCLQLVREHFYELELDPDVKVLSEAQTQPLIERALEAVFERHYAGATAIDLAVQQLVRLHGGGSDDQIRVLVLRVHRYAQSLDNPDAWLEAQQQVYSATLPTQWRTWFLGCLPVWRDVWRETLKPFTGVPAVALSLAALDRLADVRDFESAAAALRQIQVADEAVNWPRGTKGKVRDRVEDFFEEAAFLVSLTPEPGIDPLLEDWRHVSGPMLALLELAREFTAEFSAAKRDAGGLDFADIEQFALRLLRGRTPGEVTPTAREWRERLDHVFVDEYQDINAAQDAILSALSREGRAANRCLVGDVKQSIYRFRLANPGIFSAYERRWDGAEVNAQRLPLADNFRSRPGILEFVNRLFGALMRKNIGGVTYEPVIASTSTGGESLDDDGCRVELHFVARSATGAIMADGEGDENGVSGDVADLPAIEREARVVGLRLREMKRQGLEIWDKEEKRLRAVTWSDMAVLVRSPASRAESFAKEFARLGIPLEAARGGFFESVECSDLVGLLKLLDNPLQDIPLLAVLRSPLVGMTNAELAEVRAAEEPEKRSRRFWLAARQFVHKGGGQGTAIAKLSAFLRQLDGWREGMRQTSVSHCLERVLAETHYETLLQAQPRGQQRAANVRRLVALSREFDPYQRQGLLRFLRFIEAQREADVELESAPSGHDAVRLLSMHKSKGLEFPVVAVAGLGSPFNLRDLHEPVLLDEEYGLCPKVLPVDGGRSYPSLPCWLARQRQRQESLGEELRLLYVAMTRARDYLVLAGTWPKKGDVDWEPDEPRALSDREVLRARSGIDWLRLWLPLVVSGSGETGGKCELFQWTVYTENDLRLKTEPMEPESEETLIQSGPESVLVQLRSRVGWNYPHMAATVPRAKTSVTELRRQEEDDEAETAVFARLHQQEKGLRKAGRDLPVRPSSKSAGKLSAAEIGIAHHRFLQRVSLSRTGTAEELRSEAERLVAAGWLRLEEAAGLDLGGIAGFWKSDFGRRIVEQGGSVRRELPFTARFSPGELNTTDQPVPNGLENEFVIVQGIVDLLVLLPNEIWVLDFKTDAVEAGDLADKVTFYEPQLTLYARALEKIYRRQVTECLLYFLAVREMVPITSPKL